MRLIVFKNSIVNLEFVERVVKVDDPKFGLRFEMASGESNVVGYDSASEQNDMFKEVIELMIKEK